MSKFNLLRAHKSIQKHLFSSSTSATIQQKPPQKSKILGHKIFAWGQLNGSSLGLGTKDKDYSLPIELDDIDGSGYRDISVGANHVGVVTGKGDVYMFGMSTYGELGLGEHASISQHFKSPTQKTKDETLVRSPRKVNELRNVESISCGGSHTAVIDSSGELFTFGYGGSRTWLGSKCGGLGHNNKAWLSVPKRVVFFREEGQRVHSVSCGDSHTLVVTDARKTYAFGEGEHGRLGTGHTRNCKKPTELSFFKNIPLCRVFAGKEYSFGLNSDGIPFGFGRNDRGQIGQGYSLAMDMYSCDPTPCMLNLSAVHFLSLSQGDVLAVDSQGNVFNWGDRQYLEPTMINGERFQDEKPAGKIVNVQSTTSSFFFVSDQGELFSCNKTFGMRSDIFLLGQGNVEPFKIARRVQALADEEVVKVVGNDSKMFAVVK